MSAKMLLEGGQVVAFAPAIGIETSDDALKIARIVEAPQSFVHADLSREADSGLLWWQIGKAQNVESQSFVRMSGGPCGGIQKGLSVLSMDLDAVVGRGVDHNHDFG